MRNEKSIQEWRKEIEEYKRSGLSQKAWCTANGVNYHTLKNHLYRSKKDNETRESNKGWIPIRPTVTETLEHMSEKHAFLKIQIGTATVEVTESTSHELLRNVALILQSLC